MRTAPDTGRRMAQLAGVRFRECDELLDGCRCDRRMHYDDISRVAEMRDGNEILHEVITELAVERRIHCMRAAHQEPCIAVGRSLRRELRVDVCTPSTAVVDDDLLAERFTEMR